MSEIRVVLLGLMASATPSEFVQLCAGWTAILPIVGLALYGWFHGIFLAIIVGLQVFVSFLIALAWLRPMASGLEMFGCSPGFSFSVAFWLIFAVTITAVRFAVGGGVPEGAVRFASLIDHWGGLAVGAVAGAVLGGALLVGWSITSGPGGMRLDPNGLPFDSGRRVLWTFARWVAPTEKDAELLVIGDRVKVVGDEKTVRASEPFVDINGNKVWDSADGADGSATAEPFHDIDGNKAFTPVMPFSDSNSDGVRAVGLLDCYTLGDWRRVRCQHAPCITSVDVTTIVEEGPIEDVYLATASDVDPDDEITFTVRPLDGKEDVDVTINPATGSVTLLEPADFEAGRRKYEFVVEATDKSGNTDQKSVKISVTNKID